MGGMTKDCKRQWASALDIDADYDDCWHYRQHWRPDLPLLTRLQYLDFHTYLPDDILTKVDRASMAHSLELRVPFLKRELIEFAFSLPEHIRYDGGRLKGILKHAYRDILPASILNRSKKGFSVPPSHLAESQHPNRCELLTFQTRRSRRARPTAFRSCRCARPSPASGMKSHSSHAPD
jgi:asparagine synthetase B (glutamine-hydrolysing)